jgi:hypothetical protein
MAAARPAMQPAPAVVGWMRGERPISMGQTQVAQTRSASTKSARTEVPEVWRARWLAR